MESRFDKSSVMKQLQQIPGVGKAMAEGLWNLGIREIGDLADKNPEDLYDELCEYQNRKIDRCVLYVFRCAVYYASTDDHEKELLKWWKWKD